MLEEPYRETIAELEKMLRKVIDMIHLLKNPDDLAKLPEEKRGMAFSNSMLFMSSVAGVYTEVYDSLEDWQEAVNNALDFLEELYICDDVKDSEILIESFLETLEEDLNTQDWVVELVQKIDSATPSDN